MSAPVEYIRMNDPRLNQGDELVRLAKFKEETYLIDYHDMIPKGLLREETVGDYESHEDQNTVDHTWLALSEIRGKIFGYATWRPAEEGSWPVLEELYVDPYHADEGIGTQLLVKVVLDMGTRNLVTWVLEQDADAIDFFRKNGFTLTSRRRVIGHWHKTPVTLVMMKHEGHGARDKWDDGE